MQRKYSVPFIARAVSLCLISIVPALYLRQILHPLVMIAVCVLSVLIGLALERIALRLIPSALASAVFLFALFFVSYQAVGYLHITALDTVFLHLGLSTWILFSFSFFIILSTIAWMRFSEWRALEPPLLAIAFCLLFWWQGNHALTLFSHPVKAAIIALAFLFALILQTLPVKGKIRNGLASATLFIPISCGIALLILNSWNSLAVSNNGGLIQPTLFRFDFSPYLTLKDEIKMNDTLVLIVRTKQENTMSLLRRVYLSGWNPAKGFYEETAPNGRAQIKLVPKTKTEYDDPGYALRSRAIQEYFIVNFDPSSLIAIDYPISVTPFKIWDSKSFNGAYSVISHSSGFMPFELFDSEPPRGTDSGMDAAELEFYTRLDSATSAKVSPLAKEVTAGISGYYDKILALNSFFHDGEYRYSLKPGLAADGDQLSHFLFVSKKGYCTYFAFSLCLALRSLGIPSRVSAGFFIQPGSGNLDYYPIRASMAHAWVEVFFPDYGWISFDPTTSTVADGEDLQFSNNPGGDEFTKLLGEIIDKRALLIPAREDETPGADSSSQKGLFATIVASARQAALPLVLALGALAFLFLKLRFAITIKKSRNDRKVILLIARRVYAVESREARNKNGPESKRQLYERLGDLELRSLYQLEQKARYAPICDREDANKARLIYESVTKRPGKRRKLRFFFTFFCMVFTLTVASPETKDGVSDTRLLNDALHAIASENWEEALDLLSQGITLFPNNPDFHYSLGSVYSKKELYDAALKELTAARDLGYEDNELLSELSNVAGYLNRDTEALTYLSRYLEKEPDDLVAWSNFGWLCYKTNRLEEGIAALHRVTDEHGPDGNIYAQARKYYTLAINLAEQKNQAYLASIYYYNRSILEEVFYHFDDAYADTIKSLEAAARSSGYLMQGELELRKLDYRAALSQYTKANNLDSTPLALMGLAETMNQAGYPDTALQYLAKIREKKDLSWIANYGTTTDQFKADLQGLYRDAYTLKRVSEKRRVVHNFSTLVSKLKNLIMYSYLTWYHDSLFRIENTNVARYYAHSEKVYNDTKGHGLFKNSFYFLAFNKWKRVALPYLDDASNIELQYIPDANPAYLFEKGRLLRSISLLDEAIGLLHPEWERKTLAKAISERLLVENNPFKEQYRKLCGTLLHLNPTLFIECDIRLPVSFQIPENVDSQNMNTIKKIRSYLKKAGFVSVRDSSLVVQISQEKKDIRVSLLDMNRKATIYTQVLHNASLSTSSIAQFINDFSTTVFRTTLSH
jgi:transglutaminase-like putative cysteine protease/tetratricopeptide (TPR) repeat protein